MKGVRGGVGRGWREGGGWRRAGGDPRGEDKAVAPRGFSAVLGNLPCLAGFGYKRPLAPQVSGFSAGDSMNRQFAFSKRCFWQAVASDRGIGWWEVVIALIPRLLPLSRPI